jgi:hypothetical protein
MAATAFDTLALYVLFGAFNESRPAACSLMYTAQINLAAVESTPVADSLILPGRVLLAAAVSEAVPDSEIERDPVKYPTLSA